MPSRRSKDPDDDDTEEEGRRPTRRPPSHHSRREAVRAWDAEDDDTDEGPDEEPARRGLLHRERRPVYFRARDSLYFEPLVALAIIVVLLVSLYAYTSNWPPVYVVESDSMQHGNTDIVGLINTGDLVLAQKLPTSEIQTYVDGEHSGYTTYGEYGDVVLYQANGLAGTPVIHRAIVYLSANPNGTWNAPSLAALSCGPNDSASYMVSSSSNGCGTEAIHGVLTLRHVGWQSVTVTIPLDTLTRTSGLITMGDNNYVPGPPATGTTDQAGGISAIVQAGWVIGVARGSLPWVGSVKLLLQGSAQEVPPQSWEYLGLSLAGLVILAMGIHYLLRAEGVEDPRRRAEEDDEDEDEEDEEPADAPPRRRWLHPIRSWRADHEEEDEDDRRTSRGRSTATTFLRGRPSPKVGRSPKGSPKRHAKDDDGDEDL